MLKFLTLDKVLAFLLNRDGLASIAVALFQRFGLTDIIGLAIDFARRQWSSRGREGVARMATIRESSVRRWAEGLGADPERAVAASRRFGHAFADFVGAFLPE